MKTIAIAAVTAGGKTTIVNELKKQIANTKVLHFDDYSFDSLWDIHDRIREIARIIQELLKDKDLPVDTRAGYVVDLMDAYLLYSDVKFLDSALDVAYEILIPKGSDKIVLPCRTPNICRLLCNCYYFTGEDECIVPLFDDSVYHQLL